MSVDQRASRYRRAIEEEREAGSATIESVLLRIKALMLERLRSETGPVSKLDLAVLREAWRREVPGLIDSMRSAFERGRLEAGGAPATPVELEMYEIRTRRFYEGYIESVVGAAEELAREAPDGRAALIEAFLG